jgi:hypothetical protein
VFEDGDGAFVAQGLELLAVGGDVAALFDLKAAQGHADAAGAVGERIGLAAGLAAVDRLGAASSLMRPCQRAACSHSAAGQVAQHLGAHGSVSRSARVR